MKNLLWRALYAVICVFMVLWLAPLVAAAIGFPLTGAVWALGKALMACIAVLYIIWGPSPPAPF
jgi:hypothetical protein